MAEFEWMMNCHSALAEECNFERSNFSLMGAFFLTWESLWFVLKDTVQGLVVEFFDSWKSSVAISFNRFLMWVLYKCMFFSSGPSVSKFEVDVMRGCGCREPWITGGKGFARLFAICRELGPKWSFDLLKDHNHCEGGFSVPVMAVLSCASSTSLLWDWFHLLWYPKKKVNARITLFLRPCMATSEGEFNLDYLDRIIVWLP